MLRSVQDLEDYAVNATDGELGHIKDLYFDDDAWVVRYLIVNAGSWFMRRDVLISPISVKYPLGTTGSLSLTISRDQVKNSPAIASDKPMSRQFEAEYFGYFGYSNYWGGGGIWGAGMYPYGMLSGAYSLSRPDQQQRDREEEACRAAERIRHRNDDPHLRSCREIKGYHLHASDGELGHVSGFLVDDETWALRYLVVNTSHWWAGREVLIAPQWIKGVDWAQRMVTVDLTRESVKESPPYKLLMPWDRDMDRGLYRHYGRAGYWADDVALQAQT